MADPSSNVSPPQPATIVIPLPPGMDEATFFKLQGFMVNISICLTVVLGIIVWDYFVLLWDEVRLYKSMGSKLWNQPAAIAFVVLRYSGIIATLPALFFTIVPSQHCQLAASLSQVGVVLSIASSGLIFAYRVSAIWHKNLSINILVGSFYLAMVVSWISIGTQYRATVGPPTPFGSNCIGHPVPSWSPISNASSVLYDTLILVLTLLKLNHNRGTRSRVGYLIYRDSLLYFIVTTSTNVAILIIQALPARYELVKPQSLPFSLLMTVAMGTRVFLNLKLHNEREARKDNKNILLSSVGSSASGSRDREATKAATPVPYPPPTTPLNHSSTGSVETVVADSSSVFRRGKDIEGWRISNEVARE